MSKKAWVADLLREALNGLEQSDGSSSVATTSNEAPSSHEENMPSCSRPSTSRAAQAAQNAVQGEVARAFAPYQSGTSKRRLLLPAANPKWKVHRQSFMHNFFCLRGRKDCSVPSALEKVKLSTAGLGFKRIHFLDRACDAQEFQIQLTKNFPKLQEGGGFELLRTSGMTRSKKLEIIPCPESGYTPLYLTTEAGVGSSIIYVRPLQANLSMDGVSTPTSSGGPTIQCLYCKQFMRQASIPTHVDVCLRHNSDGRTDRHGNNKRREHMEAEERALQTQYGSERQQEGEDRQQESQGRQQEREDGQQKETEDGNTEGKATSREMDNIQRNHEHRNSTDNECRDLRQRRSGSCRSEEWKTEPDIQKAVEMYRHQLLKASQTEEDLTIKLNMGHSPEDRERAILQFYKAPNINWARNITVVLQGDAALGDGVKRFFFSQTMSKLQFGFELNIDGPGKTLFFIGEEDHQVPSTSKILLDSGLYVVAGRMIGHSILHGGPGLSSASPSLFSSLIGQEDKEHVCLQDCPDMDLREIIQELDGDDDLSQSQTSKINDLCLSWDLPFVNTENRRWLAEKVLVHAVLGRRRDQLKQLKRGLKDSGLMPLLKERPDALNIIFPQASKIFVAPEMILDRIVWPSDSDTESDDGLDISTKCSVTGYLREYIETGTSDELLELLKFWVGWAVLPQHLYVKVAKVSMPTAVTCFETLKIPGHYLSYREFKMDLTAAVSTTDSGFGLV